MKHIRKYSLSEKEANKLELPKSAEILQVETLDGQISLYVVEDIEQKETQTYYFKLYKTGETIEINIQDYTYLGAIRVHNGGVAHHLFYKQT